MSASARKVRWMHRLFGAAVPRILLGSLIGQGAVLVVSPTLTRLYTPADFGALAVVTAISAVLGNVVTLSWDRAIVVPAAEGRAKDIVALGIVSVTLLVTSLGIVAYFLQHELAALFSSRVLVDFWWLIPVTVAVIGYYAIASSLLVRHQRYGSLAIRNATQGVSQAVSSVVLGVAGVTPLGLISSVAVGRGAALIGMVRLRAGIRGRSRHELGKTAALYRRFPLVNTWARVLNSLGLQLPVILIISLFGSIEAGLYALTLRVLASPVSIISDAVSQYFEGTFALRYRNGQGGLVATFSSLTRRLMLVGAIPVLIVLVFGPGLFSFVFGSQWETAGYYAQLLVLSYYAQFVVSPVSRSLVILNWQATQLVWDATRLLATTLAIIVPWTITHDFAVCAATLATVHVTWFIALYVAARIATRSAEKEAPQTP